jgi:beta-glucosidase
VKDDHDYKPYLDAYKQGILTESQIDTTLVRLYTARIKLGMFDPPGMDPYSKIDPKLLDSKEHRAMARAIANEAMVLLKNDGTLPLKTGKLKLAVVGPLADQTRYLLGNYNGIPTHTVSVLEGLKAEFPQAQINFVSGTQFLRNDGDPVPASVFTTTDGKPGLTAEFATGELFSRTKPTVLATVPVTTIDLKAADIPSQAVGKYPLQVQWTGFLTPTESGEFSVGLRFVGGSIRVFLDGKEVVQAWGGDADGVRAKTAHIRLEKGKKVALKVEYAQATSGPVGAQLIWGKYDPKPSPEAVAAVKNADVVIAVLGITSEL